MGIDLVRSWFVTIDLMRIDFVGVDLVRIDLVGAPLKHTVKCNNSSMQESVL